MAGFYDMMCFLMNKEGIFCGESFFRCGLSEFWDFMKTDENYHPLHCVVMTIFQGGMNPNRNIYGRLCRSVNERLYLVGEIFMYIFLS